MIKLNFDLFNNEYLLVERLSVLLASFIPSLILVLITLYSDRKSKEPGKNILICLISGIFTISLARFFEQLVAPYIASDMILTYIWALIEEVSKILIFYLFIFDNKYYLETKEGFREKNYNELIDLLDTKKISLKYENDYNKIGQKTLKKAR